MVCTALQQRQGKQDLAIIRPKESRKV